MAERGNRGISHPESEPASKEVLAQVKQAYDRLVAVIEAMNLAISYWKDQRGLPNDFANQLHGAVDLALMQLQTVKSLGTLRYSLWDTDAEQRFSYFQHGCQEIIDKLEILQRYLNPETKQRYAELADLCKQVLNRIEVIPTMGARGSNWNAGDNRPGAERHSAPAQGPDGYLLDLPDDTA